MNTENGKSQTVSLLDYGAGNVRSLRNAVKFLGFEIYEISSPEEILSANMIIFPGVGSFGQAMKSLKDKGWFKPLQEYINSNRPFFGICIGMQSLFEGSDESSEEEGLGIIPGRVKKFQSSLNAKIRIPHIGWNGVSLVKSSPVTDFLALENAVYYVHSFCAVPSESNKDWVLGVTDYAGQRYIGAVQKGNIVATQFHPEKSGDVGLRLLRNFLNCTGQISTNSAITPTLFEILNAPSTQLTKRVVACLDVRSNDKGDLVVTKGDQYDVREETVGDSRGDVRNLGKPVALCKRYFEDGADEIVFLNITSFRQGVLEDIPMLQVLEQSSECVFVPLTVGGGIREYTDASGHEWSALDVVTRYFRSGADKVSIGSDAVYSVEEYLDDNRIKTGKSSIEVISKHYGAQAVVVSVDPKRVYVSSPELAPGKVVACLRDNEFGPNGESYCWWQCTVKGGREARDLCAVTFAKGSEELGAGEIMLNSIDMDGQGNGFDIPLITAVQKAVTIPVIASSGAGSPAHFCEVFRESDVQAALAAGIFHRNEVSIQDVKKYLSSEGIPTRISTVLPDLVASDIVSKKPRTQTEVS